MKSMVFLLGVRQRASLQQDASAWPLVRRKAFLLNETIHTPISVDSSVWPPASIAPEMVRAIDAIGATQFDQGYHFDDDEQAMAMMELAIPEGACWTLFGCDEAAGAHITERIGLRSLRTSISSLTKRCEWSFLGYDIADLGLTSGLSNCAFVADEKPELISRFADSLNEFGLFADNNVAIDFADATNSRVKEHSPFFVFEIYQRALSY
jgi:hypothetical protein